MKIISKLRVILFSLCILFFIPASVSADGMILPPDYFPVYETQQKALIIFNEGREDLVISVSFNGKASEFGWVVPLPNQPQISKVDSSIFRELEDLTKPKKNLLEKIMGEGTNYDLYGGVPKYTLGSSQGDYESTVQVIEEKSIGIYDYAVLQAEKVQDLKKWMEDNNYFLPVGSSGTTYYNYDNYYPINNNSQEDAWSEALPVFQDYIDSGWVFVTIKVNNLFQESSGVQSQLDEGAVDPLRFSFETTDMIYPMKLTAISKRNLSVMLYVFDDHKVEVENYNYSSNSESSYFNINYAGKIKKEQIEDITKEIGKGSWYEPEENMFVTKLYASNLPYDQMDEEVLFQDTSDNKGVNDGSMSFGEWLLLPIMLFFYFPYIIIFGIFSLFGNAFYWGGSGVESYWAIIIFALAFFASFGVTGLSIVLLKRTKKKLIRFLIYVFQFPAVWFLGMLAALCIALPFGALVTSVVSGSEVGFLDGLCCFSLLIALIPVVFYRLLWKNRRRRIKDNS